MPSTEEIDRTLHEALEKCYASKTPLDCLAEEIGKLNRRAGWTAAEVDLLTQKALRMLATLLKPPTHQPAGEPKPHDEPDQEQRQA